MFLSKKIAKLQKIKEAQFQKHKFSHLHDSQLESQSSQKSPDSQRKVQRYRFRQIPPLSKHVSEEPIYSLHGDWPIMMKNNKLVTELSLFNEYKTFQNITVVEEYHQKLVQIKPNARKDKNFNSMNEVMELFSCSQDTEQATYWPKTFKNYYQTYDKVMKRQSRKKTKSDTRKKFYTKVDAQTEEKTKELFEKNPVMMLKFRLRNHHSQLQEVVFGEKFIEELGHDVDSFVTFTLKEGLPQIMPIENPCSTVLMKTLIEKYFAVEENGYEIPNLSSTLLMKDGYAKEIQYNVTFLMNYETNTFGMDVLFSITGKGEPYLQNAPQQESPMNENFVQIMAKREEEAAYFLSEYYSSPNNFVPPEEFPECEMKIEMKSESDLPKIEEEF